MSQAIAKFYDRFVYLNAYWEFVETTHSCDCHGNYLLVSPLPHNDVELSREMLIDIFEYFSSPDVQSEWSFMVFTRACIISLNNNNR
jgi:hypothetical protein